MRSLISASALIIASLGCFSVFASTPLEFWPTEGIPSVATTPPNSSSLSVDLDPAIRFEQLYRKILSGSKSSEWRNELESFINPEANTPLSTGVRDVAQVWLARVEMEDIDAILLDFYRHKVRFPRTDEEFQNILPTTLAKDPWGEPWIYSPGSPHGFSHMDNQRYRLEPRRMSGLSNLTEAVKESPARSVSWTITPREIAGKKALEFHSPQSVSVIEPGGKADACTLLFIGDKWALMAGKDRIFSVPF